VGTILLESLESLLVAFPNSVVDAHAARHAAGRAALLRLGFGFAVLHDQTSLDDVSPDFSPRQTEGTTKYGDLSRDFGKHTKTYRSTVNQRHPMGRTDCFVSVLSKPDLSVQDDPLSTLLKTKI